MEQLARCWIPRRCHLAAFSRNPHVVAFGNRWLVTNQTNITHDNPVASTKGAFVDLDGTSPGAFSVGIGWRPDVAVSGERALFVAISHSIASAHADIEGRIMLADGTFAGPAFTISDAPDKQLYPAVTFDGENFLVAWQDKRDSEFHYDERTDIYGTRVSPNGEVLDFDASGFGGVAMTSTPQPERDAALITSGGTTLFAASTFTDDRAREAYRLGIADVGPEVRGDFNGDRLINAEDIDMLCAEMNSGGNAPQFDLNGDGFVNMQDMDELVLNILGTLYGDANLNGTVDGVDFLAWNANKFQPGGWAAGDFSCDGLVDGQDFLVWNANKFQSGTGGTALTAGTAWPNVIQSLVERADDTHDTHQTVSSVLASHDTVSPMATREQELSAWHNPLQHGNGSPITHGTRTVGRVSTPRADVGEPSDRLRHGIWLEPWS